MNKYILILLFSTFLSCQEEENKKELEKQWLAQRSELEKLIEEEQYEKAFVLANKRIFIAEEHFANDFRLSNAYNDLGLIYLESHDLPKAEEYLNKALSTKNTEGRNLAVIYGNLGKYYNVLYNLDLAHQYLTKAIAEYNKEAQIDTAAVYQLRLGISKIYALKKQYEQSQQILSEVTDYGIAKKDTNLMTAVVSASGFLCLMADDYSCALRAYTMASNHYQHRHRLMSYSDNLNNIATVLLYQLEYDRAIDSLQKAARIKIDLYKDSSIAAIEMKNIAAVYNYKKDSLKAKEYREIFEKLKKQ